MRQHVSFCVALLAGGLGAAEAKEPAAPKLDHVFRAAEARKAYAGYRTFDFEASADGLYEFSMQMDGGPSFSHLFLDDELQIWTVDRREGCKLPKIGEENTFGERHTYRKDRYGRFRVLRHLTKGRHSLDFNVVVNGHPWDAKMDETLASGKVVFGYRLLKGDDPAFETGFWLEDVDYYAFAQDEKVTLRAETTSKTPLAYTFELQPGRGGAALLTRQFTVGPAPARLELPTDKEGSFEYLIRNEKREVVEGPVAYAVLSAKPLKAAEKSAPVVVDRLDCTEGEGGAHLFRDNGTSRLVTTPHGTYRLTGETGLNNLRYYAKNKQGYLEPIPADQAKARGQSRYGYSAADWFGYTLKVAHPGRTHLVRCQVPNDLHRLIAVQAYDRKTLRSAGWILETGLGAASGPWSELSFWVWPNADAIDIMVFCSNGNRSDALGRTGAVRSIELVEYPDGMPALAEAACGWEASRLFGWKGEQTDLGPHERTMPPLWAGDEWAPTVDPKNSRGNFYHHWRDFLCAWDRTGEVSQYLGQNFICFPVDTYDMELWGGKAIKMIKPGRDRYAPWMGAETVDPLFRDVFRMMCIAGSKYGVKMIVDIMNNGTTRNDLFAEALEGESGMSRRGMFLESTADGRLAFCQSGRGLVNPAHPAIRKRLVDLMRVLGKRYGRFPAFAGVNTRFWKTWNNPVDPWFKDADIGYDDFTVGEFCKDTGIKLAPANGDVAVFDARKRMLKTCYGKIWWTWRTLKCLTLRQEMLAALREGAPNAKVWCFSHEGIEPETGIDREMFESVPDFGFVKNMVTTGGTGIEWNRADPVEFYKFNVRPAPYGNPPIDRWPAGNHVHYPRGFCCLSSTAAHPYELQAPARALADNKMDLLLCGGGCLWTLPPAEKGFHDFIRVFRAIPQRDWTRVEMPSGAEGPAVVWQVKESGGDVLFFVVNRSDTPRTVDVTLAKPAEIVDQVTGTPVAKIELAPYMAGYYRAKGAGGIVRATVAENADDEAFARTQYDFLKARDKEAAQDHVEVKYGEGEAIAGNMRPVGARDLRFTWNELFAPIESAVANGDWFAAATRLRDFRTNHAWWYEVLGWPKDFADARPLPSTCTAVAPSAETELTLVAPSAPGGFRHLEVVATFGGGAGDLEVLQDGRLMGTIPDSEGDTPRSETRVLDVPLAQVGEKLVLTLRRTNCGPVSLQAWNVLRDRPRVISRYQLIGCFEMDGDATSDESLAAKPFPPETDGVDRAKRYTKASGEVLQWQDVDIGTDRIVRLNDHVNANMVANSSVAYLATTLYSDADRTVTLCWTADFFGRIWVNGEKVQEVAGPYRDYGRVDVKLRKGANAILFRTWKGRGVDWGAGLAYEYVPGVETHPGRGELVPTAKPGCSVPSFLVFGKERHQDLSFLVDRGFAVLTSDAVGPDAQIDAIRKIWRSLDDDERFDKWLVAFVGSSLTPEQLCDLHPTLTLPRQREFQTLTDWDARIAFLDAHGWRSYAVKPDKRIPDLLTTFAGEKVTDVATWERVRRPELKDFFERNVYGKRPVERPEGLAFRDLQPPKSVYGGLGVQRTVEISWPGRYQPGKFTTILYVPAKAEKPVPAFAYLSLKPIQPDVLRHEVWAVSNLLVRGIASAAYWYKDVAPDWGGEKSHDNFATGVYACFEKPNERTGESWGAISAWAWGLSRVMDFLETVPEIDPKRVRAVGLSRGGKTALWAAAVDERFEGACATGSGCCGAGMNAVFLPGEDLNRIHARFPYWFCGNFAKYAKSSEQQYPGYDQHQMLALIAPRHLYVSESLHDTPRFGDFEGVRWSAPAWELYGLPTLKDASFPEMDRPLRAGRQSFHLRHGFHDLTFYDWLRYAEDITSGGS